MNNTIRHSDVEIVHRIDPTQMPHNLFIGKVSLAANIAVESTFAYKYPKEAAEEAERQIRDTLRHRIYGQMRKDARTAVHVLQEEWNRSIKMYDTGDHDSLLRVMQALDRLVNAGHEMLTPASELQRNAS